MPRHVMVENYVSRDVSLYRGELVIALDEDSHRPVNVARQVFVKTRHGRKVRVPPALLSREQVVFNCPLCDSPPQPSYPAHVSHLVHGHLKEELRRGLNLEGPQPACPFPSCTGIVWPDTDSLLVHYASDHHVLDKVMMYESEVAAVKAREQLRQCLEMREELGRENTRLRAEAERRTEGEKDFDQEVAVINARLREKELEVQSLNGRIDETLSIKDNIVESATILKEQLTVRRKEVAEAKMKRAELEAEVKVLQSKLKRERDENKVSSSAETIDNTEVELEELYEKVERFSHQNEVLRDHNVSLRAEVEKSYAENDSLKNIIETGKSTVETANKLSQDLATENKKMKVKQKENAADLKKFEKMLSKLKDLNEATEDKYERLKEKGKNREVEMASLQEQIQLRNVEIKRLQTESIKNDIKKESTSRSDSRRSADRNKYDCEMKTLESNKKDLRIKLVKCREEMAKLKEDLERREKDSKILMAENKQHAQEVKALKIHLHAQREIVVEKAVAKEEMLVIRAELESKTSELELISSKLSRSDEDLRRANSRLKEMEIKCNENVDIESGVVQALKQKLRMSSEENKFLQSERKTMEEELTDLKEQRISQSEEVKNLKTSLLNLQRKAYTELDHDGDMEDLRNHCKYLESRSKYLNEEKRVSEEENNELKQELGIQRSKTSEISEKYSIQMQVMTELMKQNERMAAQLRRKDWEISNYQSKLDVAFEDEMVRSLEPPPDISLSFAQPNENSFQPPPCGVPPEILDLSTKTYPELPEFKVKIEAEDLQLPTSSRKRNTTECSIEGSEPLHSDLNTSRDSDSTCPSEASRMIGGDEPRNEGKRPRLGSV